MFYFLCLILTIFPSFPAENYCTSNSVPLEETVSLSLKRTTRCDDSTTLFPNSKQNHNTPSLHTWVSCDDEPDTKRKKLSPFEIFEAHVDMQKIPYQGWKIHISANPEHIDLIRNKVTPLLITLDTNYKIVKTYMAYLNINTNPDEQGKYITIYPNNEKEACFVANGLNNILKTLDKTCFTSINGCISLGQSGGLWIRYGQFKRGHPTKEGKVLVVSKVHQFLKSTNKDELLKLVRYYKLSFVHDDRTTPFPHFVDLSWLPFDTLSYIYPQASTFPNSTIDFSNDI